MIVQEVSLFWFSSKKGVKRINSGQTLCNSCNIDDVWFFPLSLVSHFSFNHSDIHGLEFFTSLKTEDTSLQSPYFPGPWAPETAALEQMDNGDWGYMMTDPVTLNVGGHLYTTSLTTLTRYPDSMLGAMFGGDFPTARDPQGNYFIDRDGPLFRYVLNFLRTSELTLPLDFKEFDLLRKEADFYQIEPLIQCLNDPKPLYPMDTFEEVVELSSTRKLSKYSNPVAVIITQLTITTKVHSLLEGISNYFTKWNKHMMDTRDCQVSFTFGPCDYHQEVSLRVHLMEYITKQGFTIRNTRVHHMSERANENTVEHNWTFCRLARKTDD
ncbi:BTB/POZ domain-containing protein KCTD6 isoform X4 [Zalophus californianus]|uniref:BTB/POZ domain-containing protein KCTD6 isoform X1 n=2 Tax=Otariidae TaxID=9702 RepID=A0A3Q7QGM3_CALUR|nr:BTB/POZ domain-containing protein KCTD6 isoform X1 [Callorhinus ursinus]XP_027439132.1 BTB/POZ domain-containing protein KCTD6 isoform X4 [Zalophus californianus]